MGTKHLLFQSSAACAVRPVTEISKRLSSVRVVFLLLCEMTREKTSWFCEAHWRANTEVGWLLVLPCSATWWHRSRRVAGRTTSYGTGMKKSLIVLPSSSAREVDHFEGWKGQFKWSESLSLCSVSWHRRFWWHQMAAWLTSSKGQRVCAAESWCCVAGFSKGREKFLKPALANKDDFCVLYAAHSQQKITSALVSDVVDFLYVWLRRVHVFGTSSTCSWSLIQLALGPRSRTHFSHIFHQTKKPWGQIFWKGVSEMVLFDICATVYRCLPPTPLQTYPFAWHFAPVPPCVTDCPNVRGMIFPRNGVL